MKGRSARSLFAVDQAVPAAGFGEQGGGCRVVPDGGRIRPDREVEDGVTHGRHVRIPEGAIDELIVRGTVEPIDRRRRRRERSRFREDEWRWIDGSTL
jgi:hypothetical protein